MRPFQNAKDAKQAKLSDEFKSAADTEDEARSPRSPFMMKDLTLFDELTLEVVDCEAEKEKSPAKKQRTAMKTKRRGIVMI